MNILHNIDNARTDIMMLEMSDTFDQSAWDLVLGELASQERPAALADAMRRMNTARANARFMSPALPADAVNLWLDA